MRNLPFKKLLILFFTLIAADSYSSETQTFLQGQPVSCDLMMPSSFDSADIVGWDFNNDGILDWNQKNSQKCMYHFVSPGVATVSVEISATSRVHVLEIEILILPRSLILSGDVVQVGNSFYLQVHSKTIAILSSDIFDLSEFHGFTLISGEVLDVLSNNQDQVPLIDVLSFPSKAYPNMDIQEYLQK